MNMKNLIITTLTSLVLTGTAFADTIRLGSAPNLQTVPIVVAEANGYFAEEGIEIELTKFTSGRRALEALIGGQLDVAFMAEYPVSIASLREQPFGTFTTLSRYVANRLISKGSIGFEDISSLEGKKVGTTKGSNTEFFTERLLETNGVSAEVINVSPPDIVPALARGDIDAGVMFPDFYASAAKALGDDYREFRSDAYVAWFVLSATPDMLENRASELEGFVRALVKAEEYIKAEPEGAQMALAEAMEGIMSLEMIKSRWAEAEYEIGLPSGLLDVLEVEANWVVSKGMVEAEPSRELIKKYLATGPLSAVDASRITLD